MIKGSTEPCEEKLRELGSSRLEKQWIFTFGDLTAVYQCLTRGHHNNKARLYSVLQSAKMRGNVEPRSSDQRQGKKCLSMRTHKQGDKVKQNAQRSCAASSHGGPQGKSG